MADQTQLPAVRMAGPECSHSPGALRDKRATSPQPMWPGLRDHQKTNPPTPEVSPVPVSRARWAPVSSYVSSSDRGRFAVGGDPALENGLSPSLFMALGEALGPRMLLLLLSHFTRVRLSVTPETAAHEAPPSLGFSRQEHWSGLPFPSPVHESEK